MDLGPLIQTAVGGGVVILANHVVHRHRVNEARMEHRRAIYLDLLKHLRHVWMNLGTWRVEAKMTPRELTEELQYALASLEVSGATEVHDAVVKFSKRVQDEVAGNISLDDPAYYDAVLTILREEYDFIVAAIRTDQRLPPLSDIF